MTINDDADNLDNDNQRGWWQPASRAARDDSDELDNKVDNNISKMWRTRYYFIIEYKRHNFYILLIRSQGYSRPYRIADFVNIDQSCKIYKAYGLYKA